MAAAPPPAPVDGALPFTHSSPSPSHPSATLPDPGGGEDGDEGTKMMAGDNGELADQLVGARSHKEKPNRDCNDSPRSKISRKEKHKECQLQVGQEELRREKPNQEIVRNEPTKSKNIKSGKHKGGLPVGSISASPRVTASPGVNMLVRAAAVRRTTMMVRSGSAKSAKMAGSPKGSTSQQSLDSPLELPPISPSLDDLSLVGRTTSSHSWKRRPRKLLSRIWKEVEPIYQGRKLVRGRCVHCQQVFPASRDSGSSHIVPSSQIIC